MFSWKTHKSTIIALQQSRSSAETEGSTGARVVRGRPLGPALGGDQGKLLGMGELRVS